MKKITVLIPNETYIKLLNYCKPYIGVRYYFKDVINKAILNYCVKNTVNFSRNKKILDNRR